MVFFLLLTLQLLKELFQHIFFFSSSCSKIHILFTIKHLGCLWQFIAWKGHRQIPAMRPGYAPEPVQVPAHKNHPTEWSQGVAGQSFNKKRTWGLPDCTAQFLTTYESLKTAIAALRALSACGLSAKGPTCTVCMPVGIVGISYIYGSFLHQVQSPQRPCLRGLTEVLPEWHPCSCRHLPRRRQWHHHSWIICSGTPGSVCDCRFGNYLISVILADCCRLPARIVST